MEEFRLDVNKTRFEGAEWREERLATAIEVARWRSDKQTTTHLQHVPVCGTQRCCVWRRKKENEALTPVGLAVTQRGELDLVVTG